MGRLVKRLSLGALLVVFGLSAIAFGQTEILVNGDFEAWTDASTPTGWTHVESITQEATEVHGGTYSAKHLGGTKDLGQYVTVTPGYTYDITVWYKVTAGDGEDARIWSVWKSAGVSVYDNTDGIRGPNGGYFDNNGGVWTKFDTTVVAPETVDTLYFELRAYSGSTVYWDDLSVVETAPPPEDPADYFIPKGAHAQGYVSLKAAVDSINIHGAPGMINLVLDADTLREESFTFNADLNADSNVTVKPAPGRDVVLIVAPGASEGNGPQMIGFDKGYVTFDGSNDGTDSRNLIVTSEGNADVPFGFNGPDADFVTLKNLIIKNLDNGVISFRYGVVTNDVGGQEDLRIENCQIASPEFPVRRYGIAIWGDWTYVMADVTVLNSEINAGAGAIENYLAGNGSYINNTFNLYPSAAAKAYCYGIRLSWAHSTEIRNNVFNLAEEKTVVAASQVRGIKSYSHPAGAVFTIENNIFNLGAADETCPVSGIEFGSSNNARTTKVYHNTFVLNDNASTSACNVINKATTGSAIVDLKNNIIINKHTGSTASSAISLATNAVLTSDNNILVSDQNCVSYLGTAYENLADWQAAGQDAGSDSIAVTFVSATDLHLAAPSDTDLDLVMPAVGVLEDIDGDARGTFFAYAGADEGTAYPDNDLHIGFKDASDVANWVKDAWENVSHDATRGALQFADGGWGAGLKRAVNATSGSIYKLTLFVETSGWDAGNMDVKVLGLGNDLIKKSIISEGSQTEISLIGIADGEDGNIYLTGSYPGTHPDTLWVDSLSWDNQYLDIIPSDDIASVRAAAINDMVAGKAVLTATTIGAPVFGQDATGGIALYEWDIANDSTVVEGDEILFVGKRAEYKGLQQIKNIDDYVVLSKNNIVEPELITVPDLASRDYQGMLVMVEDVDTVDGFLWPTTGNNASITLTDGTNEFTCRIDKDGEMDESDPPTSWPLDLIGVVSEYSSPQIMPRYMDDFITNQAPMAFTILNPADSTVITSFDDPEVEYIEMDGDSVYALFANWTDADDPEGDTLEYEMHFIGEGGPDEPFTTNDTMLYIPLDQDRPYNMNGTYVYYFTATDPMGEVAMSDTHVVIFDFPAPPRMVDAQVVLVDDEPTYYVEFDLPVMASPLNFKIVDWTDGGSTTVPTSMNLINTNTIMLGGTFVEDHVVSLVASGVMTPGVMIAIEDTSEASTVYIPFSDSHPEDAGFVLEDFETGIGLFKALTYSGSTKGILSTSTFAVSEEEAYEGSKSGKMNILDDTAVDGGWFVRIPYDYPSYNTVVKSNSVLMFLIKGTAADVKITMTIKDSGYERAMWKNVTLCENDWQVVAFDLANDPVEGWITGDNVITGETVKIADVHISCDADEDAVLYIDGFTERQVLSPVNITLSVMMDEWLRQGKFNLAMDYVDVAGTFNGWDGSSTIASDFDGDTTYSVTVPLMPFSTQNFKFRINGSWNDATAEFPYGGPARELVVPATAEEFTYWYNNDTLVVATEGIPTEFALHQNYPNPFNPTTTINFDLPSITDVSLVIYDITGRKVRTLVNNSNIEAGYKKIVWNGRDDFGNGVATGMYIYRLVAGDYVDVKKMTFLK